MADGTLFDAGTGRITLTASEDVTLGGLRTSNNTEYSVVIGVQMGSILDGGDIHRDIDASGANAQIRLSANNNVGIGSASVFDRSGWDPIEAIAARYSVVAGNDVAIDDEGTSGTATITKLRSGSGGEASLNSERNVDLTQVIGIDPTDNLGITTTGTITLPVGTLTVNDLRRLRGRIIAVKGDRCRVVV